MLCYRLIKYGLRSYVRIRIASYICRANITQTLIQKIFKGVAGSYNLEGILGLKCYAHTQHMKHANAFLEKFWKMHAVRLYLRTIEYSSITTVDFPNHVQ